MAVVYSYNTAYTNCAYIYRATTGGTVYSANLAGAVFDYFNDAAVVNDAIYFSSNSSLIVMSNLKVNVGTAIAGTGITGVWEYLAYPATWTTMHDITDPTAGFTVTGAATITFPIQGGMFYGTVSSGGGTWVRYRLTAITTITEGGANQTTAPSHSNGTVSVAGGTDATPATFTGMYNWVIANAPEIGATNLGSYFKFDNMQIDIASRLLSRNEQVFIGNGSCGVASSLQYLESGTKVGTDGWSNASSFFFCVNRQGAQYTTSQYTKMYGAVLGGFTNYVNGATRIFAGFLPLQFGEWIGCTIQQPSGYFSTLTSDKCTFPGGLITASFPTVYPTNMRISDSTSRAFWLYAVGGTINGLSYPLPTTAVFLWNQYGGEASTVNFVNCTPLPEQTDSVKVMARGGTMTPVTAITNAFYYDASAGTYTDYSTAAGNATVDDVPLDGDVGDIYYFRSSLVVGAYAQLVMAITLTAQSNDYVYAWEYYRSGAWGAVEKTWDSTNNFTTSGRIYNATRSTWATQTINGVAGYWLRLRITTKGTGAPKLSKILASNQAGVGEWHVYEKSSCVFNITDKAGVDIQGAVVKLRDAAGTTTTLTTDVNGLTTSTDMLVSTTQFDPNESDANYNVLKTSANPYTITVEKAGYERYEKTMSITEELTETIGLKRSRLSLVD